MVIVGHLVVIDQCRGLPRFQLDTGCALPRMSVTVASATQFLALLNKLFHKLVVKTAIVFIVIQILILIFLVKVQRLLLESRTIMPRVL